MRAELMNETRIQMLRHMYYREIEIHPCPLRENGPEQLSLMTVDQMPIYHGDVVRMDNKWIFVDLKQKATLVVEDCPHCEAKLPQ